MKDRESFLEAGLVLLGLGLAAGLGILLLGRAMDAGRQAQKLARQPPAAGRIHPLRHQHISTVAAR